MAYGETLPVVRKAMADRPLRICFFFVADTAYVSFLGLNILRRISGRGTPRAMTGLRSGSSERCTNGVGVNAGATYQEPHELLAGMLAVRRNRTSQQRFHGGLPRKSLTDTAGGGTLQQEKETTPADRWWRLHPLVSHSCMVK
jgi:hypothetical protein